MYIKNYVRLPLIVLKVFQISFCSVDIFTMIFVFKMRRFETKLQREMRTIVANVFFFFFCNLACFCNSHIFPSKKKKKKEKKIALVGKAKKRGGEKRGDALATPFWWKRSLTQSFLNVGGMCVRLIIFYPMKKLSSVFFCSMHRCVSTNFLTSGSYCVTFLSSSALGLISACDRIHFPVSLLCLRRHFRLSEIFLLDERLHEPWTNEKRTHDGNTIAYARLVPCIFLFLYLTCQSSLFVTFLWCCFHLWNTLELAPTL